MLSILAIRPTLVSLTLIVGAALTIGFLKDKIASPVIARKIVFVLVTLMIDSLIASFFWFKYYSSLDKFIFGIYVVALSVGVYALSRFTSTDDVGREVEVALPANEEIKPFKYFEFSQPKPLEIFLYDDLERIVNQKTNRLLLLGPYGSGKESVATLCAYNNCQYVIKPPRNRLKQIQFVNDDYGVVVPDMQSLNEAERLDFENIVHQGFKIYCTSTVMDIASEIKILKDFTTEYLRPLTKEELKMCFYFYLPSELSVVDIKWDYFYKLTKMLYPPQVKQIVSWAVEEYKLDNEALTKGQIQKIHIAKALEQFLNQGL
ncbi:MAG: hypothetical protein NZO16_03325 [Deltaproteobacteria bacterium]|nr:hypothetical protein [Deltaproteobacteria bacterium]